MPRHFLYVMDPEAKAPAGDGDTESWFRFYKWNVEGEVFVPRAAPYYYDAQPGDFVWFAFCGRAQGGGLRPKVFGWAQIVRVEEENRRQEIWYRGDEVVELAKYVVYDGAQSDIELPQEVADEWMTNAERKGP